MCQTLLCPLSRAHEYSADYHIGRPVLGLLLVGSYAQAGWINVRVACYSLQPEHLSSLPAPNFQPTATQEPDGPCGNQHYIRELLMMGITVPETC
jgi:hypothetical protein